MTCNTILVTGLTIGLVIALAPARAETPPKRDSDLLITKSRWEWFGSGVTITGLMQNTRSDVTFEGVTLFYALYDKHGYKLSEAFGSIQSLKPHETWKFKITRYVTDEPKSVKFGRIEFLR